MPFVGEITRTALVANDSGDQFYAQMQAAIEQMGDRYVEVHYQTELLMSGRVQHSVLLIGRERNKEAEATE